LDFVVAPVQFKIEKKLKLSESRIHNFLTSCKFIVYKKSVNQRTSTLEKIKFDYFLNIREIYLFLSKFSSKFIG